MRQGVAVNTFRVHVDVPGARRLREAIERRIEP